MLFCHHGWILGHCHSFGQLQNVNINGELVPPSSRPIRGLESQQGKGTANRQPLVIQTQSPHNRLIRGNVSGNFGLTSMGNFGDVTWLVWINHQFSGEGGFTGCMKYPTRFVYFLDFFRLFYICICHCICICHFIYI